MTSWRKLGKTAVMFLILTVGACGAVNVVKPDRSISGVLNLDFEGGVHAGRLPNGWVISQSRQSGRPQDYTFELDEETVHSGEGSLRIQFTAAKPTNHEGAAHGGVSQCLQRPELTGGELTMSGYIKTEGAVDEGASMWMQASDGKNQSIAFKNMDGRRARGTTPWQQHEISISLPSGTEVSRLCFGFFHDGRGTVWADDLSLRVTGEPDK